MSATGQKRARIIIQAVSTLPPKADIVSFGSICPLCAISGCEQSQHDPRLLDHLIGTHEQRWWHCEAKRLRSFEVDHQLESRGLFDWHINWVCAPQNLVHDVSGASKHVAKVRPVGHQAPGVYKFPHPIYRRQPAFCSEFDQSRHVYDDSRIPKCNKAVRMFLGCSIKYAI